MNMRWARTPVPGIEARIPSWSGCFFVSQMWTVAQRWRDLARRSSRVGLASADAGRTARSDIDSRMRRTCDEPTGASVVVL
jgi:hypothetical protein